MAKGKCPYCNQPMPIKAGQQTVSCGSCGGTFDIIIREKRIRLRPANDAPSSIIAPLADEEPEPAKLDDVFLLDLRNAAFVAGRQKSPASDGITACGILFMIPFFLGGFFFLGFAIFSGVEWWQLRTSGVVTQGYFEQRWIASDEDGDTYYSSYSFQVDGTTYTGRVSGRDTYDAFESGKPVEVLYVPSNPGVSTLGEADNFPLLMFCGVGAFALIWNLIIGAVTFNLLNTARRNQQIRTAPDKQLVRGKVAECRTSTDSDGDFWMNIKYDFLSPRTGKLLSGQEKKMRNDLKHRLPPIAGTPVAVLYVKDDLYCLM